MFIEPQILLEGEISPEGENIIPKWSQDDIWNAFFPCTFPNDNQFNMWACCFLKNYLWSYFSMQFFQDQLHQTVLHFYVTSRNAELGPLGLKMVYLENIILR